MSPGAYNCQCLKTFFRFSIIRVGGGINTLPLLAYAFLHKTHITVVISRLVLFAGPSLIFLKRKKSHTRDLIFPGYGKRSSSAFSALAAMTVQKVVFGLLPFGCPKRPQMNRNSPNGRCDVSDRMPLCTIESPKITIDCRRL